MDSGSRALFDALHTHTFSFHSLSNLLLGCYNDRIHLIPGRYYKGKKLDAGRRDSFDDETASNYLALTSR